MKFFFVSRQYGQKIVPLGPRMVLDNGLINRILNQGIIDRFVTFD